MKTFYQLIKSKLAYGVIAIVAISNLSACVGYFSDRAHSERLFEQYCHEEGRVGQFIYERAALGEEYFRPIPSDAKELRYVNEKFYIDDRKLLIDKQVFKQSYILNNRKRTILSQIGPIYSIETTIIRKSDGKLLSRAVSLLNMLDKTSKYFPVEGVTCPTGRDITGRSLYFKQHMNLIENTFFTQ